MDKLDTVILGVIINLLTSAREAISENLGSRPGNTEYYVLGHTDTNWLIVDACEMHPQGANYYGERKSFAIHQSTDGAGPYVEVYDPAAHEPFGHFAQEDNDALEHEVRSARNAEGQCPRGCQCDACKLWHRMQAAESRRGSRRR